jgi:hypothetical protein
MTNPKLQSKNWKLWVLLPFVLAGAFILVSVIHYGVNTPFWDEWEMVSIFQDASNGKLSFHDFWAQHNEHRILFPNLVLTGAAYVTHWNIKAELLINFFFSIITALMLYLFILSRIKRRALAVLAAVLIAVWFYSPVQYENWLWGWQVEWFMCVTGIIAGIYLIDSFCNTKLKDTNRRRLFYGAALLSATIATYSMGDGMLVWPVGLGLLLLYRQDLRAIGGWLVSGIVAIALYYYHYHKPAGNPSTSLFLHQRLNFIKYFLSYLGRPVTSNIQEAMLVGAVLIAALLPLLYVVWLKRDKISKFAPWLALIALPLLSAGITDVSRLGFGVAEATASRYTAFSLLYIIGLTGLTCALLDTFTINRHALILAVLSAVAISGPPLMSSYVYGIHDFRGQSILLKEIKYCTHEPDPSNSCLLMTYPRADVTRLRLEYLKTKHWAGY